MGSFSFSIFLIYAYLSSAKPDIKLMIFSSFHFYSSHLKFYLVILFFSFNILVEIKGRAGKMARTPGGMK